MRFLADENFPAAAVAKLQQAGHDVISITADPSGIDDRGVLALTAREGRILLTFDEDFGELTKNAGLPLDCGVVLFRVPMPRAAEVGKRPAGMITAGGDWAGHFSVIDAGRIRMRPLK